eukprot:CAMPEP_0119318004 /NCGR_PEP_ID=MMETSP1333-20130426/45245_1 /TAXON_ID=418940 /ORGANISM="Scyphosphaera apsteinii, Strain RCC1455" /LENGTH=680 /DNA_ID=CAMNT_0007324095 /DNA_START=25 /DNA_END=2067 /DNA_ORIENTATION=-
MTSPLTTRPTQRDVQSEFQDVSDPALTDRLLKLCHSYNLSASQLSTQWELLQMNGHVGKMTLETLAALEHKVGQVSQSAPQSKRKTAAVEPRTSSEARPAVQPRTTGMNTYTKDSAHLLQLSGMLGGLSTPKRARPGPASFASPLSQTTTNGSPSNSFVNRVDAGKVLLSFQADLGFASAIAPVKVHVGAHAAAEPRRAPAMATVSGSSFMWEKLDARAELLDEHVQKLEREIEAMHQAETMTKHEPTPQGHEGKKEAENKSPHDSADIQTEAGSALRMPLLASAVHGGNEEVTFVGRICCEGEGKLNPQSIFLEGSRARCNACRYRLDLSGCPDYALFPGQAVAVCGMNTLGHTIVAKRIVPGVLPPQQTRPLVNASFNVITATGPFTCSDDLSYAPLDELLKVAVQRHASAIVLVGPFVDEVHPTVSSVDLSVSFLQLFSQTVLNKLQVFVEERLNESSCAPHIVLIPSIRDVHHSPVFPQPPFVVEQLPAHIKPYVHLAPNPTSIFIGGVSIACCSLDVLMLLTQQELASKPMPDAPRPDRMSRLASHVIKQRLFLPLYPAPTDERALLPVDVTSNLQDSSLHLRPHVLVMPSELAPFAKVVEGDVVCVNSGRLTRKQAGGNFAVICVHPPISQSVAADEASAPSLAPVHAMDDAAIATPSEEATLASRICVEVRRI